MLSPAVVRNTQFTMTWLRPGYEPREVDAFLNQVGARMDRNPEVAEVSRTVASTLIGAALGA